MSISSDSPFIYFHSLAHFRMSENHLPPFSSRDREWVRGQWELCSGPVVFMLAHLNAQISHRLLPSSTAFVPSTPIAYRSAQGDHQNSHHSSQSERAYSVKRPSPPELRRSLLGAERRSCLESSFWANIHGYGTNCYTS